MSLSWSLDVARELRWFFSPSPACPWGGIAFGVLLVFIFGCICGATLATCFFSATCRTGLLLVARLISQQLGPSTAISARDRLAEYHSRGL